MIYVIRNGQYLVVEKAEINDIQVSERPHENAEFIDGTWVLDAEKELQEQTTKEAMEFLDSTDWKVLRHQDQLNLGIETSLSEDEYLELLEKRQEARGLVLNDEIE